MLTAENLLGKMYTEGALVSKSCNIVLTSTIHDRSDSRKKIPLMLLVTILIMMILSILAQFVRIQIINCGS